MAEDDVFSKFLMSYLKICIDEIPSDTLSDFAYLIMKELVDRDVKEEVKKEIFSHLPPDQIRRFSIVGLLG
jgi:hypothetical protein